MQTAVVASGTVAAGGGERGDAKLELHYFLFKKIDVGGQKMLR